MNLAYCDVIGSTPIQFLGDFCGNSLWVKRDDMIPFCFGGNKARKAQLFFHEIDADSYDAVVTYGSSSSNHCRVIANLAVQRGLRCCIISPEEASKETFNAEMMRLFRAEIIMCPISRVSETIEETCEALRRQGHRPFFIPGGGHGNIGTQAYVNCYEEIREHEEASGVRFDYVFLASGTGTTQAGLICGKLIHSDEKRIVGISIARKKPRGRDVVLESVRDYLRERQITCKTTEIEDATIFLDEYVGVGYGACTAEIERTIADVMREHGIPLDITYTGKAFWGMTDCLKKEAIQGKNILFVHTGGAPLFFDYLRSIDAGE